MRPVGAAALLHGAVHLDVEHGERFGVETLDLFGVSVSRGWMKETRGRGERREKVSDAFVMTRSSDAFAGEGSRGSSHPPRRRERRELGAVFAANAPSRCVSSLEKRRTRVGRENPGVAGGDPDGERRTAPPRRADAGRVRVVRSCGS